MHQPIQYASKLFISRRQPTACLSKIIKPSAPVLALCGDIGSPFCKRTVEFMKWCQTEFDKVLWVPGVEEWTTNPTGPYTMNEVPDAMQNIAPKKIIALNNSSWLWKNGKDEVLFLGTTLWGPCRFIYSKESITFMYQNVKELHNLYYTPVGSNTLQKFNHMQIETANKQAINWLKYQIDDSREEDKKRPIVILSYTTPSILALGTKDKYDLTRLPMRNTVEKVIGKPVSTWIYGDVTENYSYTDPLTAIYYTSNSALCSTGFGPHWTTQVRSNWYPPVCTSTLLSTAPNLALPFDE
jgi:hypothetical protein